MPPADAIMQQLALAQPLAHPCPGASGSHKSLPAPRPSASLSRIVEHAVELYHARVGHLSKAGHHDERIQASSAAEYPPIRRQTSQNTRR